ncbi:exopolysaccharide production protein ExoQ [Stenotrophomonas geniculata]|uniref:O-antigen ligase family protein n=1 Tax=Stenotrophomonas geniculata TaxID=86188 RepID=UPI0028A649C5|nr:O-antigen ligase family protein [Stenotrophomonas geniculata]
MYVKRIPAPLIFIFIIISVWVPNSNYGSTDSLAIVRYAVYAACAIVLIALGAPIWAPKIHRYKSTALLILLCIYWCVSTLWSQNPTDSAMKSILLLLTLLASVSIALRPNPEHSYSAIVLALSLFMLASFVVCLIYPDVGLETSFQHAGKWKGLAGQKNPFGLASAVTFILLLAPTRFLPRVLRPTPVRLLVLAVCATCLWMSGSRGTLVDVAAALMGIGFVKASNRLRVITLATVGSFLVIFLCLATLEVTLSGSNVSVFGHAIDTSNRLLIWGFAFDNWNGHELLGVGYGGFWNDYNSSRFETMNGWVLPNFHNGYVSILIETGILGSVIFLLFAASLCRSVNRSSKLVNAAGLYTISGMLALFFFHNIYENNLTRSTDFLMLLFFVSVVFIDHARYGMKSVDTGIARNHD